MERILEFTGKKTTEKQWILRPENAREFKQNATFSKINRRFSVRWIPYFLPWPAFLPIFDRGLGRVSKWHARGKNIKKRFYGIYIEIKQLEVGHDVITMKLECHLKWFITTSTIKGLGEAGTLDSTTRVPLTLCTFSRKTFGNIFQKKLLWKIPLTFLFYRCFCRS